MMDRLFSKPSLALRVGVVLVPLLLSTAFAATPTDEASPAAVRARLLEDMGVPAWHAAGWRGQGVKVAVLDSGFRGYKAHLGEALPEHVTVHSFRTDGDLEAKDSAHGILCGEVIHAIAPEAELLFANWEPERPDRFLEAVRWARRQGARIVTCSLIMPTWSDGDGGGEVHQALADALGNGDKAEDVLFFSSAGNTAQRHWGGPFRDGGDGRHEWAPGRTDNAIRPWDGETPSVELCWRPGAVYELTVRDLTAGRDAGRAEAVAGDGHCCAAVGFAPEAGHDYAARVRLVGGNPGTFHLTVLGGDLDVNTPAGSVPFPGDGAEVVAVGAVDRDGRRPDYCSRSVGKPDLDAVAPFPSLWRPRPFSGTSAAAPEAAGLAALLLSRHPGWTAAQGREALQAAAGRAGLHLP